MSIFTRFRDIIHSNINALLDKAEDPEKLIQSMIYEIEDTLVELKSSCATVIAEKKGIERRLSYLEEEILRWDERSRLAVTKGKDDLAKEALKEKFRLENMKEPLLLDIEDHNDIISQYHKDISLLQDKLLTVREKKKMMVIRHRRARQAIQSREEIRRMDSYDEILRFDELEDRIARMEAEADLILNEYNPTLEDKFEEMMAQDRLEKALERLKKKQTETAPGVETQKKEDHPLPQGE